MGSSTRWVVEPIKRNLARRPQSERNLGAIVAIGDLEVPASRFARDDAYHITLLG